MKNLKLATYSLLGLAIVMELGSVIWNLANGYSPFYLNSDVLGRFSLDNKYFLIYWGAMVGANILAYSYRDHNFDDFSFYETDVGASIAFILFFFLIIFVAFVFINSGALSGFYALFGGFMFLGLSSYFIPEVFKFFNPDENTSKVKDNQNEVKDDLIEERRKLNKSIDVSKIKEGIEKIYVNKTSEESLIELKKLFEDGLISAGAFPARSIFFSKNIVLSIKHAFSSFKHPNPKKQDSRVLGRFWVAPSFLTSAFMLYYTTSAKSMKHNPMKEER